MVKDYIKNYRFYDGIKKEKSMSATQFSRDILQLYLAATSDSVKPMTFGRGEIGSIFHMGMEEMFKAHPATKEGVYVQEKRFSRKLGDYEINGKMDLVDFDNHIIYDWKGMGAWKYGQFTGKYKMHPINVQMAIYSWLLGGGFSAQAHCFITDWNPVKETHPASAYQIIFCDLMDSDEIEAFMQAKIDALELALKSKKQPPVCEDVMPSYVKPGVYINARCAYYCEYAHVCKRRIDQTAKVLGLKWGK